MRKIQTEGHSTKLARTLKKVKVIGDKDLKTITDSRRLKIPDKLIYRRIWTTGRILGGQMGTHAL